MINILRYIIEEIIQKDDFKMLKLPYSIISSVLCFNYCGSDIIFFDLKYYSASLVNIHICTLFKFYYKYKLLDYCTSYANKIIFIYLLLHAHIMILFFISYFFFYYCFVNFLEISIILEKIRKSRNKISLNLKIRLFFFFYFRKY